jgi:phosphoserine phosphatase RsbU/P
MTGDALDLAPAGYLCIRDDGVIVNINRTLLMWLGYSPGELEGKTIETILTISSRIFYNTHFYPLVKLHAKAEEIFLTLTSKTKSDIPVLANAERRNDDGSFLIHCIFIPVHQRKKYETEILEAKRKAEDALKQNKQLQELTTSLENKTLELDRHYQRLFALNQNLLQFSKVISHDLQEPLRKIELFSNMIMEDGTISPRINEVANKIRLATERLRVLTKGLQEYVIVDAEKNHVDVDLNEVVQSALARAKENRKFDDFDMNMTTLPVIVGYRSQLELLFFHLFDNSIQFRQPERKLEISLDSVFLDENVYKVSKDKYLFTEHVRLVYSDNASGFDGEYNDYVFQLLSKINPETGGLGIGLPLIKKIVENHSGTITAESKKGQGTKFVFILPLRNGHH